MPTIPGITIHKNIKVRMDPVSPTFSLIMFNTGLIMIIIAVAARRKPKPLMEKNHEETQKTHPINTHKSPHPTDHSLLIQKLIAFEQSEDVFQPGLTASTMEHKLQTNRKYLGEAIRQHANKEYRNYINDLKIDRLLAMSKTNGNIRHYKLSGLASLSGFKDCRTFHRAFLSKTGITVDQWLEQLNKEK